MCLLLLLRVLFIGGVVVTVVTVVTVVVVVHHVCGRSGVCGNVVAAYFFFDYGECFGDFIELELQRAGGCGSVSLNFGWCLTCHFIVVVKDDLATFCRWLLGFEFFFVIQIADANPSDGDSHSCLLFRLDRSTRGDARSRIILLLLLPLDLDRS